MIKRRRNRPNMPSVKESVNLLSEKAKKFRSEINEGPPILETVANTFVVASTFSQQQQQQFIHKQEIMFYSIVCPGLQIAIKLIWAGQNIGQRRY